MTLEKLEQYADMLREAKMWKRELDELRKQNSVVKDTVRGSMQEFPYTEHPVTIEGIPTNRKNLAAQQKRLEERWETLYERLEEIWDFIDGLEDSQLRQIIQYHYVKGYSWVKTARLVNNKESAVKMRVKRHFA